MWQFQSVWTDRRSVLEQMNLHFCFSLFRNEWYGTPCRVLSARPFSSTCYNSNKKRRTISESPLNLEYVSSAQRPSQHHAEMRYVSATFSVVRSKSVNKFRQLQCTWHLDFLLEYKTAKIIIRWIAKPCATTYRKDDKMHRRDAISGH